MVGTITYWNSEKQFGFAVTEDGEEFYVGAGHFTSRVDVEGTRIRFDRAKTKSPDASWTGMLNDGRFRDTTGINPRNPRPPRRPRAQPAAPTVVVIGEHTNS